MALPRGQQAAEIAEVLRREIIAGTLTQDRDFRQERLADRFGVSRMPVREALRILEASGLVVFAPNKGATLVPLSAADLIDISEMRVAAETLALRRALPELSNAQIERAAAIQAELEGAALSAFGDLNERFHKTLYAPCGRPRLLAHIESLGHAADRYLRLTVASLDYAPTSHGEHHALLEACRKRDEDRAVACLSQHIMAAGEALAAHMAEQG